PPVVEGEIRIVSVPDFDHSACGGTHPAFTGTVGVLCVRRRERRGDETRIEFVCGARVVRDLHKRGDALQRIATSMTLGLDEVEDGVRRLRENEDRARKQLAVANARLLELEAAELTASAPRVPTTDVPVVRRVIDAGTLDDAKAFARAIVERGGIALVGLRGE